MPELNPEQRNKLIQLCKDRVIAIGMANICEVSDGHKAEIGINEAIEKTEAETIGRFLEQNDRKYELFGSEGSWCIKRNLNYELTESVKATNLSVKETNYWTKRMAILSVVVAAITGTFIALQFFKDASPNLQPLYKQLEQIKQLSDSMQKFQKGIDSSLSKAVKDSFYRK